MRVEDIISASGGIAEAGPTVSAALGKIAAKAKPGRVLIAGSLYLAGEALKADEELKGIPILAVTAYAGKGDEEAIRDAGAEGYLAKPVSIAPFMVAVNALV